MTRALSAIATLAVLGAAALLWSRLDEVSGALGLARFDPLSRVALAFAALTALEMILSRLIPPPGPH